MEFILRNRNNSYMDCLTANTSHAIPKHIHQIYISNGGKTIPIQHKEKISSWKITHPSYEYTLWNSSMIEKLLQDKYPTLAGVYFSYSQWINKVDMAKYVILHHRGGIYADVDTLSVSSGDFQFVGKNAGVILHKQFMIGIKADFMISVPTHSFFRHVINGLEDANRWYLFPHLTTILRAGPVFLHGRFLNYRCPNQVDIISQEEISKYFHPEFGGSWHSYDTIIFNKFFDYLYLWMFILFAMCVLKYVYRHLIRNRGLSIDDEATYM